MRLLPKLSRVAVIFILVIIVFGVIGFAKYKDIRARSGYENKLMDALYLWEEAKNLRSLNEIRSRELAGKAKSLVDEFRGVPDKRISSLVKDMEEILPQISGEYFVRPSLIFDLELVEKSFSPGGFVTTEKGVFVFDEKLGRVVFFNFEGKETRIFEVRDVPGGANLAAIDNRIFLRDNQRIVEVSDKETKTAALSDGNWGEVKFVLGFGENLYVGDREQVWKYVGLSDSRFGSSLEWLGESGKRLYQEEVGNAVSYAIDGSLWIFGKDGDITKLIQGRPDYFMVRELDQPFSNPIFLHTRDDLDNLYILDSGNKRVVVLDKKGEYKAQYFWDGMSNVDLIAVSEEENKILFFIENKVYQSDLKNGRPF